MTWATAIVLIVALMIMADVIKSRHRAQNGIVQDSTAGAESPSRGEDAALKREIAELRERIKVLERIATDDSEPRRLSAEIDRLREL